MQVTLLQQDKFLTVDKGNFMKLNALAIGTAARILLSGQVWTDCKMFVQEMTDRDYMTNEEKHAAVKKNLRIIFKDIRNSLLDIGIKLAVLWLEARIK